MTRVHRRHVQPGASSTVGAVHHQRAESRKKPSYRVVMEEVAGVKKLKSLLSFKTQAPPGYMFIPAGDPQITNRCKKIAKDEQLTVFIVSTSKNTHDKMSREVHRIGYHFPSTVVDQACMTLGVTLTSSGRVLQSHFAFIDDQGTGKEDLGRGKSKNKRKGKRRDASPTFDMTLSQAMIDTQAREAIQDLFPKIPPQDLHEIIGRAFQKGKGLVGTVGELSLVRRAQLAVTAHIRHVYTHYDQLLKSLEWIDARRCVQKACLDMLVQWRGDDDDDGEMEDILREVIVISDDEKDDDDHDTRSMRGLQQRSPSVELISVGDIDMQPINYANARPAVVQGKSATPDSDDAIQYLGAAPIPRRRPIKYDQHRLDQLGVQRHRLWEEAIDRRRRNHQVNTSSDEYPPFQKSHSPAQGPYQPQSQDLIESRRQAFVTEDEGHGQQIHKPPRLNPTSKLVGQVPYELGPRRRLALVYTEEALPQYHQLAHPRAVEESRTIYHVRDAVTHQTRKSAYNIQAHRISTQVEEPAIVALGDEKIYASYSRHSDNPPRRRPEMILPSVEGSTYKASAQQIPSPDHSQRNNPSTKRPANNREPLQYRDPSVVYANDEPSQQRRPKTNAHRRLDEYSEQKSLVPFPHGEVNKMMHPQSATAAHHEDVPPFVLDRRIVQLPPRENHRYESQGEERQVNPSRRQLENQPVFRAPYEYSHPRHVDRGAPEQPHSPKSTAAFQIAFKRQSPIFSDTSAALRSEALNSSFSSHRVSGMSDGQGHSHSGSRLAKDRVQYVEDTEREPQREFRQWKPQRHWDRDSRGNMIGVDQRDLNAPPQNFNMTYLSTRPRADDHMRSRKEHRQQPVYAQPSVQRTKFQHSYVQPGDFGCDNGRRAEDIQYVPQQTDHHLSSSLREGPPQRSSMEGNWNNEPHSRKVPRNGDRSNTSLQNTSNFTYVGSENIRPVAEVGKDAGRSRRGAPGELIVLE